MLMEHIGEPAMLELLAEECTELAQAALKLARADRKHISGICRAGNPADHRGGLTP